MKIQFHDVPINSPLAYVHSTYVCQTPWERCVEYAIGEWIMRLPQTEMWRITKANYQDPKKIACVQWKSDLCFTRVMNGPKENTLHLFCLWMWLVLRGSWENTNSWWCHSNEVENTSWATSITFFIVACGAFFPLIRSKQNTHCLYL